MSVSNSLEFNSGASFKSQCLYILVYHYFPFKFNKNNISVLYCLGCCFQMSYFSWMLYRDVCNFIVDFTVSSVQLAARLVQILPLSQYVMWSIIFRNVVTFHRSQEVLEMLSLYNSDF